MKITAKDLADFHIAKKISEKCPYCQTSNWSTFGAQPVEPMADHVDLRPWKIVQPLLEFESGANTGRGVTVLPLSCMNCGGMRYILFKKLEDWLNQRGVADVSV